MARSIVVLDIYGASYRRPHRGSTSFPCASSHAQFVSANTHPHAGRSDRTNILEYAISAGARLVRNRRRRRNDAALPGRRVALSGTAQPPEYPKSVNISEHHEPEPGTHALVGHVAPGGALEGRLLVNIGLMRYRQGDYVAAVKSHEQTVALLGHVLRRATPSSSARSSSSAVRTGAAASSMRPVGQPAFASAGASTTQPRSTSQVPTPGASSVVSPAVSPPAPVSGVSVHARSRTAEMSAAGVREKVRRPRGSRARRRARRDTGPRR